MSRVKVSVIMPVYNAEKFLNVSVNSILNQTFDDFELILVDDGSTDNSPSLCDSFSIRDKRVKVIHQQNSGICMSRNVGILAAQGDYVAFSDHDDEYDVTLIEKVYHEVSKTNSDVIKFGKKEVRIKDGRVLSHAEFDQNDFFYKKNELVNAFFGLLNSRKIDCVWDAFFKRDFLLKNEIFFDKSFKCGGEDIDFMQRAILSANSFSTMKGVLYNHYLRDGISTSTKYNEVKITTLELLLQKFTLFLKQKNIELSNYSSEYIKFALFYCFNGICAFLCDPQCKFSFSTKKMILMNLRNQNYLPYWLFQKDLSLVKQIGVKYSISYFLYKYKLIRLLFLYNKIGCMTRNFRRNFHV